MTKHNYFIAGLLSLLLLFGSTTANAQNDLGKSDDLGRIVLTPYVVSNANIPSFATNALKNKLAKIAAEHGLGGNSADPRFVITANLIEVSKDITPTAPPMVALTLAPTIYIGDAVTGELFASCDLPEVKGVGANDTKAYLAAVKLIKTNDARVVACINNGKAKIVEYYNSQIDFLLAEAESLANSQRYDEAMTKLAAVPEVCKDAYMKAMEKLGVIYQQKIDKEGAALYNEAYAQWNTAKTEESAARVVELLAEINPLSAAAAQGRTLVNSVESHYAAIEARRRELEERNWAFKMKQYEDSQANLAAEREYRVQQSKYDYEVNMECVKHPNAAAAYAYEHVRQRAYESNRSRSFSDMISAYAERVKSWFM